MKIEQGKPTNKRHNVGRKLTYPFNTLQVNQCITVEPEDNKDSIIQSAYQYARRKGIKIKVETDENGITRIYRTK